MRILPYRCCVVPFFYLFKPSSQTNFNSLKTIVGQQNSVFYRRRQQIFHSLSTVCKKAGGGNVENKHEKRTGSYERQLICISICHQFFFIRTRRITLSSVRALKWNVFWKTCVFAPRFSLFFLTVLTAQAAFGFQSVSKGTPLLNCSYATRLISAFLHA